VARDTMIWHDVAAASDIPEGEAIQVRVGSTPIAIYKLGGRLYATHDTCTHAYACLSEGYIEGEHVDCPLHQGRFHIPTGRAVEFPAKEDVRSFPVREQAGRVLVEVEAAPLSPEGPAEPPG
jgi:nitrite reductase/ring-hydroxylating ferredoxin subunit